LATVQLSTEFAARGVRTFDVTLMSACRDRERRYALEGADIGCMLVIHRRDASREGELLLVWASASCLHGVARWCVIGWDAMPCHVLPCPAVN
jgi:hypothetical protein